MLVFQALYLPYATLQRRGVPVRKLSQATDVLRGALGKASLCLQDGLEEGGIDRVPREADGGVLALTNSLTPGTLDGDRRRLGRPGPPQRVLPRFAHQRLRPLTAVRHGYGDDAAHVRRSLLAEDRAARAPVLDRLQPALEGRGWPLGTRGWTAWGGRRAPGGRRSATCVAERFDCECLVDCRVEVHRLVRRVAPHLEQQFATFVVDRVRLLNHRRDGGGEGAVVRCGWVILPERRAGEFAPRKRERVLDEREAHDAAEDGARVERPRLVVRRTRVDGAE